MLDPIELTRKMLPIVSTTGQESAIAELVAQFCHEIGLKVESHAIEKDRPNLLALHGQPTVLLCTHLDTVPPHLEASEDEHFLYGRGACDAKGIMASMLAAASKLVEEGIQDFGLLFLAGEETDSLGAKRANAAWGLNTRHIVVGEPTESRLAIAQKGLLTAKLHCHGIAAHGAYPEAGHSALQSMVEVLYDLYQTDWGSNPDLGANVLNVGRLHAGVAVNVIPALAVADLQIRVATNTKDIERRLENAIYKRAQLEISQRTEALRFGSIPDLPTMVAGFGTDLPYLTSFGERYLIGPGSILDAHTPNEKIAKLDLLLFREQYASIVKTLLQTP